MSKKRRLLELGKDAAIVLLLLSALFLSREIGLWSGILPAGGLSALFQGIGGGGQAEDEPGGVYTAAAAPFYLAVVNAQGGRYGLTHGESQLSELYGRFSAALGEALGSSGEPEAVTEAQWRAALAGPGVYFDFLYEQPLSVLAVWLGTEIGGGAASHTARRLCLSQQGDSLTLYYLRARDGGFYRCSTALSASELSDRMGAYTPNGASFVWELTDDESLDAYALMPDGLTSLQQVSAANPLRDTVATGALLELFGLNDQGARSYTESDGTIVYVEGDATLRISASGTVSFRGTDARLSLGGRSMSAQAAVEAARALCAQGPGATSGAARLSLAGVSYDQGTNSYSVRFEYAVDGVPVLMTEGAAVEMRISDGALAEAVMVFRSYTLETETVTPLPRGQALAAVRAVGGGEPLLAYLDDRSAVRLQWLAG